MRFLPFISACLIAILLSMACSNESEPDSGASGQRGERRPLSEPPQTSYDEQTGGTAFVSAIQPRDVIQPDLPIRGADADPYDLLDYLTLDDGPYGFRTILGVFSSTDHIDYDMIGLEIVCDSQIGGGMLWVYAAAFPSYDGQRRTIAAKLDRDADAPASVIFTRSAESSDIYLQFDTVAGRSAQLFDATRFLAVAKGYETALVRLPFAGGYISAEIELSGVFNTPVQPNLDWCGRY